MKAERAAEAQRNYKTAQLRQRTNRFADAGSGRKLIYTGALTERSGTINKKGILTMAIRNIREMGDPVLNKICKEVKEITPRTGELIDDLFDTMYEEGGVGLAACQVGVLKRIVVIDVTGEDPILLINPVIIETSGEQFGNEGCLSVPGKAGMVRRPNYVKVRANDRELNTFELEGTELLARAICHEVEHLDGHLYVEKVEGGLKDVEDIEEEA